MAPRTRTSRSAAQKAVPRPRNTLSNNPGTVYESGSQSRRTIGWNAPTTSPNHALLGSLATLRDRSRAAVRNDGYASGVIGKLVANLIGTGIKPLSQATDPALRKQIQQAWNAWTDESDADGLLDFYGQQAQIARLWLEAGEGFARIRPRLASDDLTVPLQIQVVEPELCPHTYSNLALRIRAGVEFNPIGQRVAYWFYPSRPEMDDYWGNFYAGIPSRVPAESITHLFHPLRAGQIRGLPHLTQALIKLFEMNKFDDAYLLRQQIANLFAGFITPSGTSDAEGINPLTGQANSPSDKPIVTLEPGTFQELAPGEEVKFSDPPDSGAGYPDFMRVQLRGVSVATGIPYEVLTGDMSGMNDRTVRVVLNEFKRLIQTWQHQIIAFQFCRPIWKAWMDRAFVSGALPLPADYVDNPEPYLAVKWMPPRWAYLHPVQDVQADKDAIRAGFTSRAEVVAEYGEDAEEIDREQAEDNARSDELGLRYDSDGRQPSSGPRETFTQPGTTNENDPSGDGTPTAPASAAQASVPPVTVRIERTFGPVKFVRDASGRLSGLTPDLTSPPGV